MSFNVIRENKIIAKISEFAVNWLTIFLVVLGMTSSVEYFTFDGSPASAFVQNGSLPEIKYSNGDVTLYTCLYQPMGCGKDYREY